MDTAKIRELPQKARPSITDMIIVEDNDGTKTTEISAFRSVLQETLFFNTVEDMKNAVLKEGDTVTTLGYHSLNDGGGARYQIVYAPTDLDDGILVHYLHTSDTLRAHLIHNGELNVLQAGAFGDGETDDYTVFNKVINLGYPMIIPTRKYRISGSLNIPSGRVIDFNNSEIICPTSSCVCVGLNKTASNIVIKNGIFNGQYGVETYAYASNVTISDNIFRSSNKIQMSKGIIVSGSTGITISNNVIGDEDYKVDYGIFTTSSKKGSTVTANSNILIHGNRICIGKYGIDMTSTVTDKNIHIVDNQIKGMDSVNITDELPCAIQISANANAILVSSCGLDRLAIGVQIAGLVDVKASFTDITANEVTEFYSFLSDQASISISGMQKLSTLTRDCYLFDRMTGTLTMNTDFDITIGSGYKCYQARTSLQGTLIDTSDPTTKTMIDLSTSYQRVIIHDGIPGYKNIALNVDVTGTIENIPIVSLEGQVIALYSSSGAVLKHNSNILIGKDITLDQYVPVIVKNIKGLWTRVK